MSVSGSVTYAVGASGLPVPPPEVIAAAAGNYVSPSAGPIGVGGWPAGFPPSVGPIGNAGWPLGLSEQARGTAQAAVTGVAGPRVVPQLPQSVISQQSEPSEAPSAPGSGGAAAAPVPETAEGSSDRDESGKRKGKNMQLPSYGGLTSLETFLAKFERISKYLKWKDEDRLNQLCAALDGPAGQVLWGLPDSATAESVIALLNTLFGNDLQTERFRAELRARRHGPGEPLQLLYNDVTRMVSLAHPGAVEDLTNYVAKEAFINALDDGWLKMRVMDRQPANIEQALGIAGRLEANESTCQVPAPP